VESSTEGYGAVRDDSMSGAGSEMRQTACGFSFSFYCRQQTLSSIGSGCECSVLYFASNFNYAHSDVARCDQLRGNHIAGI